MRKRLFYISISLLALTLLASCGGGGKGSSASSAGSSVVSITVGGSGQTAKLKLERNTFLAQAKLWFGGLIKTDAAVAAIPSNVSKIAFTISASDMTTITREVPVSGHVSITESFTVPNGNNRYFLVEAKNTSGTVLYKGSTTVTLDSTTVTLNINMDLLPTVLSATDPANGATGVALNKSIIAKFSEAMDPSTINTSTFFIKDSSNNPVSGTVTYSSVTATFTPSANLAYNTAYTATITTGVKDLAGNAMANSYSWSFTTKLALWAKTYGGSDYDNAYAIQQTSDGGYIVAGSSSFDAWVLKLNSDGSIAWQKRYGDTYWNSAYSIQQTSDGGYIVAGEAHPGIDYQSDAWVLKLNSDGSIAWQKRYGGSGADSARSIQQTSDGGYIVAGYTSKSFGHDAWILKLDSSGGVAWQKTYGRDIVTGDDDYAYAIQQTSDGGYIVAGYTKSFGAVGYDMWVFKLNSDGTIAWQKIYGNTNDNDDHAYSIRQTSDGGYIVAGDTYISASLANFWVLKLDGSGNITWSKNYYNGLNHAIAYSVRQATDGGYIVAGYTASSNVAAGDAWVVKLNSDGSIAWQKAYGGSNSDYAYAIQQTSDSGYIVAGYTDSFGAGYTDMWVLKLNSDGTVPPLGVNTGATAQDTSAAVADVSATVTNTSVAATNTSATVTDTNATVTQQAP